MDGIQFALLYHPCPIAQSAIEQLRSSLVQSKHCHRCTGRQFCGGFLGTHANPLAYQVMDVLRTHRLGRNPVGGTDIEGRHRPQTLHRLGKIILPIVGSVGHVTGYQPQIDFSPNQAPHVHRRAGGCSDIHFDGAVSVGNSLGKGAAHGIHRPAAVGCADGQHGQPFLSRAGSAASTAACEQKAQCCPHQQRFSPHACVRHGLLPFYNTLIGSLSSFRHYYTTVHPVFTIGRTHKNHSAGGAAFAAPRSGCRKREMFRLQRCFRTKRGKSGCKCHR